MAVANKKLAPKDPPTSVKVIAILYYIGAGIGVLGALALLFGSSMLGLSAYGSGLGGAMVVGAIVIIGFAILGFFVGRGLWRLQNWARITAIVLAVLGIIDALATLAGNIVMGIIFLAINGWIGWYLLFNEEGKEAFS